MTTEALSAFSSDQLLQEVLRRKERAEQEIVAGRKAMQLVRIMSMAPSVLEGVTDIVCAEFNRTRTELLGLSRNAEIVKARHIAIWLAHERYGLGVSEIGRYFMRDHSTAMHAIKAVSDRIATDAEYAEMLTGLKWKLGNK